MISYDARPDGVVVLTLRTSTMTESFVDSLGAAVDRLEAHRDALVGVVLTAAGDEFMLGMDLKEFSARPDPLVMYRLASALKGYLRRLETLGRPVVAALTGTALGGGLELALACHHRIAADRPDARFGLPEVTLGLLPGGGGVTRVVRLLGLQNALMTVLLQGRRMRPAAALDAGLLDAVVPPDELLDRAIEWIHANPGAAQPWDRPGYRLPGGIPRELLPAFPANLRKQLKGAHYPAPHHIMCAAVEGASVDIDTALRIEGRWFADLIGTPIQRNLTAAFFFDLGHLNKGGSRPSEVAATGPVRRVGVVGAGMMGAGIAAACARRGIDVVVMDVSADAAERAAAAHERITGTGSLDDLAGSEVVIEAVFEDQALKHSTYRRLASIAPDALLASNTSSLPITGLATAAVDPARFIGLHFFSPVEKMALVEIIRGRSTSDETLARAYDLVRQIGKTPIVVNDSRGFFTSRVFGVYVLEGLAMLAERLPAASIEQAALQAGYPVGPLAVVDEVTLTLPRKLRAEARAAGVDTPAHPGDAVLDRMVEEFGRTGKAGGAGFYDYPADGRKRLWPGLAAAFGSKPSEPAIPFRDMQERLLFAEALEAVKCLEEGVLHGKADGNIGSLLGIGFPAWTGGVLRFVDEYPNFTARSRALAATYGPRFLP